MQALLPFLLTVQQGQAVAFLLPALSQVVPQATEQDGGGPSSRAWLTALLDKQVALARSAPSWGYPIFGALLIKLFMLYFCQVVHLLTAGIKVSRGLHIKHCQRRAQAVGSSHAGGLPSSLGRSGIR